MGWLRGVAFVLLLLAALGMQPVHAAPRGQAAQVTPGASPQLYLLPAGPTDVVLETHLADLRVVETGEGAALVMEATYRLRNPTESAVDIGLRLVTGGDAGLGPVQGLALSAGDQSLPLAESDGGYTGQVSLAADGRLTLRLVYQVGLGSRGLALVRYAPAILTQWPGNISLRVQVVVPATLPSDAWMEISPAGWNYGVTADPTAVSIKWLYDANLPDAAFLFRFVTPGMWAQLRAAAEAARGGAPAAEYVRLGDLYCRLYDEASSAPLRARFYAQAVAAYSAGLESPSATPQDEAALHGGLAGLYRDQVVQADVAAVEDYARLVVGEAAAALALLPGDSPRHAELASWQADGLRLLLDAMRTRRDWTAALALVEQLALQPAELVDPAFVAEARRAILVQQALQYIEQGNREAALAIAGDQIADAELTPPADAYPLFTGWQLTVTAGVETLRLDALASTKPERHAEALAALQEVIQLWNQGAVQGSAGDSSYTLALEDIQPPMEAGLPPAVRLSVTFPSSANGALLANLLPPRRDWALLQTLLVQLAPAVERQTDLLWQLVTLRQPLDLDPAEAQWEGVAAGLEQQAAAFEAAGGTSGSDDTAGMEAALQARIQAVNYRAVAQEWRTLARQSRLLFVFEVEDPVYRALKDAPPARAWYATLVSPAQMLVFQTQVLALNRVLLLGVMAVVALIGTSGVLWWLL